MTISFKILILALVAAAVFAGCSRLKADRTRAIEPDGFVSDPTVEPLCADTKAQVPYEVLEARRGDFIRISWRNGFPSVTELSGTSLTTSEYSKQL